MKIKQLIVSVGLGFGLTLILLVGMASANDPNDRKGRHVSSTTPPPLNAAGNVDIRETDLTSGGDVYEVNPDAQGNLWLSDYDADQVWQLNRATLAYTIYNGLRGASDARRDNNNNVWWNDYDNGLLGRIDLAASTVTTWTLPGANSPWGLAIDDSEQIWVTDANGPQIYRFNLTTTQVCSYTVPNGGSSDYIVHDAGNLWIGDYMNYRLVKFDSATDQFTYWQLPFESYPEGLAVDGSGNLWWADISFPTLGRLEPATSRVTTYTLPIGGWANMVAISGEAIWYTEGMSGTFGVMNPSVAISSSVTVTTATVAVTPNCAVLGAGITSTPVISTGEAVFTPGVFTPTVNSDGWTVYQLPSGSYPWGIANTGGVWISDQDRDKLVRFSYLTYLPVMFK